MTSSHKTMVVGTRINLLYLSPWHLRQVQVHKLRPELILPTGWHIKEDFTSTHILVVNFCGLRILLKKNGKCK